MNSGDGISRYGSNDNNLRLWKKVDWMVVHSVCKHVYQILLPAMHLFSDPEQYGMSGCELCYPCLYFEEEERVTKTVSVLTRLPFSLAP